MPINSLPPVPPISSFYGPKGKLLKACYEEDVESLKYFSKIYDLDNITDHAGDPLLHFVIYYDKPKAFDILINLGLIVDIRSKVDGGSPLALAAYLNKTDYVDKLIALGADVNLRDDNGMTPLLTALVVESHKAAELLLDHPKIDVNIPDHSLYTPLQVAYESNLPKITKKIINHPTFDATFHKLFTGEITSLDYTEMLNSLDIPDESILTAYDLAKEFGHKFDFNSCIPFTNIDYHQIECLTFEGFTNFSSINAFSSSLTHFHEDIVNSSDIPAWAKTSFNNVKDSFSFSLENLLNPTAFYHKIKLGEIAVVPAGWYTELGGHSITFVFHDNRLYFCNRGEGSDGIHGITEFVINKPTNITENIIGAMLSGGEPPKTMQEDLIDILGLEEIGRIENPAQTVGNCSWASLEAALEAVLLTNFLEQGIDSHTAHTLAKKSFTVWEEYDLSATLLETLAQQELLSKHGIYDDLLINTIHMHHNAESFYDVQRGAVILNELHHPDVFMKFDEAIGKYLIKYYPDSYDISYMKTYEPSALQKITNFLIAPPALSEEGKLVLKGYHDFLKACDAYQSQLKASNIDLRDVLDYSNQHLLEDIFNQPVTNSVPSYEMNTTAPNPLLPLYNENEIIQFA